MSSNSTPKRAHKKSKLGCRECKRRKVKCDERRPVCQNCIRRFGDNASCEWELPEREDPTTAGGPSGSRRLEARRPSLPRDVGSGMLDPFEAHPPTNIASVDILMNHYLSTVIYRSFPFFATIAVVDLWWPVVRDDPVLFHVTLLLSCLSLESLQEQKNCLQSKQLLTECISLLSTRVQDPLLGVSDETIVAVANLATIEHERGNMKPLQMHLSGLRRMVNIRGGLNAIRSANPMVANLIFWMSLVAVNELRLLPREYGPILPNEKEWLFRMSLSPATVESQHQKFQRLGVDRITSSELLEVAYLSRRFTVDNSRKSPEEAVSVLSQFCAILHRLLNLDPTSIPDNVDAHVAESCRFAAALHVFNPLSGYYPDPTLMVATLIHRLKSAVSYLLFAAPTDGTNPRSEILLWLLSVGGIAAAKLPEHDWFVGHLYPIVADLGIESWEQMREGLLRIPWYDNFCEVSFGKLWDEVSVKRESFGGGDIGSE